MLESKAPICIGGVGGSGTRLFAQILALFSVYMGSTINDTDDNLWFSLLFKRKETLDLSYHKFNVLFNIFKSAMTNSDIHNDNYINIVNSIFKENQKQDYLYDKKWAYKSLLNALENGNTINACEWGWKEPNTHIILPYLLKRYKTLKYIHVMRNGLDMAFSKNQNQLKFWTNKKYTPKNSLEYWIIVHKKIFDLQKKHPENIFIVDYDNFCLKPNSEIPKLLHFLQIKSNLSIIKKIKLMIHKPDTVGRYKNYDLNQFSKKQLQFMKDIGYLT